MDIVAKRIYEPAASEDGYRVLVDRLWPRGESKVKAQLDRWDKDVAPSPELRKWWGHNPDTLDEFKASYLSELEASPAPQELLAAAADKDRLTLLYAAHDPAVNHAIILADYLRGLSAAG